MAYFRKVQAKNKKGYTWSFTIELGRDSSTGKRKQITRRGFKSKKEAELAAHQMTIDVDNETFVNEEKNILFINFITDHLHIIAEPSVKASTFRGYKSAVEKRLIPKFGHMKIKDLSGKMISTYYNELLKEGLTEEFIQYIHAVLKNASKTAIDWKYIKNDFMNNVKAPRRQKKNVETWSIEECNTFLNRMRDQKDHIFILYYLAIYTGMRRGELLRIK